MEMASDPTGSAPQDGPHFQGQSQARVVTSTLLSSCLLVGGSHAPSITYV